MGHSRSTKMGHSPEERRELSVDGHSGSTSDDGDVRAVIEAWAAAVRRKDFEGILSNHAENIVMFDVPPPLQSKGLDAYRRTWDLFYSWSREPILFDIVEMTVTAGSDVAFVAAVMRCSGT